CHRGRRTARRQRPFAVGGYSARLREAVTAPIFPGRRIRPWGLLPEHGARKRLACARNEVSERLLPSARLPRPTQPPQQSTRQGNRARATLTRGRLRPYG